MDRTQLIIVRHGQTQWNLKLIRQGHLDSPLTEKGIAQAKALGERLMRKLLPRCTVAISAEPFRQPR